MNNIEINDKRNINEFKNISFSGFQKNKVKVELIKNIINNKIEQSSYWSIELITAGHFIELWNIIIHIASKYIHIGNPKLSIYLALRYNHFKNILINGYINNELKLRNNQKIRKLFAEIICILCISTKKHSIELIKINQEEFDISLLTDKLKADNINYSSNYFKTNDPKQLFIALNELSYNLHINNTLTATYWVEWILQFETISKQQKINIVGESRTNMPINMEYQKDIIWIIWDAIFNQLEKKNNKILEKIINSLLELFCIKYSNSCKKKRKNIIYFVIILLTENINYDIRIISQDNNIFIEKIVSKIDILYKEIKKNELNPNTDYLFSNLKEDQLDKTISKIEMMNELTNLNN